MNCPHCEGTGRGGRPPRCDDLADAECIWCDGTGKARTAVDKMADVLGLFRYRHTPDGPLAALPPRAIRPLAGYLALMHYQPADIADLNAIVGERDKLRSFFEEIAMDHWGLVDPVVAFDVMDGGDFQLRAERLGLLVRVPADQAFRDEYDVDEMLVWAWSAAAKAQNDEEFERGADIHIENRREIRRLQKEIERLREALILIRDRSNSLPQYMVDAGKIAREALKEAEDE